MPENKPAQPMLAAQVQPNPKNLLNEMAYEILVVSKKGPQYLKMLEHILKCPVYIFGKPADLAAGNEGRNEFIRALINGANVFMNEQPKDNKVKTVKRSRKEVITHE